MSKTKMRCITCGKWFQSANAKEVTCPDCIQKARKEKLASKNTPPASNKPIGVAGPGAQTRPAVPPPPKPKPARSGTAQWLDTVEDVKVGQPDQPPPRPKLPDPPAPRDNRNAPGGFRSPTGPGSYRDDRERGPGNYRESRGPGSYREENRSPGGYRVVGGSGLPPAPAGPRPRQPMEGGFHGPRPDRPPHPGGFREGGPAGPKPRGKDKPGTKPAAPPKPKREKIPPPQPFTPTPEQVTQVEERYLELATPLEFDGIRTQIGRELSIPKKAVKKIIKELRDRRGIPSWWELQTYKGSPEEMERIKNAYLPLLPVPPVGVHKQIADQLELKAGVVYQAIKALRLEMNLPQYNDPSLHGPDFVAKSNGKQTPEAVQASDAQAEAQSTEETPPTQAAAQSTEVTPLTQAETQNTEETPLTQAVSDVKEVEVTNGEKTEATADAVGVSESIPPAEA